MSLLVCGLCVFVCQFVVKCDWAFFCRCCFLSVLEVNPTPVFQYEGPRVYGPKTNKSITLTFILSQRQRPVHLHPPKTSSRRVSKSKYIYEKKFNDGQRDDARITA